MYNFFRNARILTATLLLAACTPARTGVIGNTLTTNVKPEISITGIAPFSIRDHGRMLVESGLPSGEGTASLAVDYAFFADEDHPDRLAYAAIVRITNDTFWHFQPPAKFDEAFSESRQPLGGYQWSEQLLRVARGKDWASGAWEDLGGSVPEFWLVKRGVTHLNNTVRAVMEYREPWPAAMRVFSGTVIVSDEADAALQEFLGRADAVFTVEKKRGQFNTNSPKTATVKSRIPLDAAKTIGSVIQNNNSN